MLKTYLSCFIAGLLLLAPTAQLVSAGQQKDKQETTVEVVKARVSKLGVGAKAKAKVTLKNGTSTKGYIARVGDDDFVVLAVEEDTVRIAEPRFRPAESAQRLLASLGALPVDHDLARRFDRNRELVPLRAD